MTRAECISSAEDHLSQAEEIEPSYGPQWATMHFTAALAYATLAEAKRDRLYVEVLR